MGQEVNINVTEVHLLNDKNRISVEVMLNSIWEKLIPFQFIFIKIEVNIPVIEKNEALSLVYPLQDEIKVDTISEETRSVIVRGEFLGNVDLTREIKGTSLVYGYNKVTREG